MVRVDRWPPRDIGDNGVQMLIDFVTMDVVTTVKQAFFRRQRVFRSRTIERETFWEWESVSLRVCDVETISARKKYLGYFSRN